MLEIEAVHAGYGALPVLEAIGFHVEEDEVVGLVGPNGAGKTTLVRALAGLLRPSAGAIRFAGHDVTAEPGHRRAGEGMAFVLDNRALFSELTVRQNLALAERMGRRSGRLKCFSDDAELFDLLPVVRERIDTPVQLLSGGQQQMVAIARALLLRPRLLVMDEPSAGLAPLIVKHILELLHRLKGRGIGILVVEQNVRLIAEVADRGYVMSLGRLVHEVPRGAWRSLLEDERLVHAYLGG
ncbi:ABC transporter ATP-binding protein [Xanthobacter dioxanivorans]|uniref:ABC transporter ATP-binding protein n=1 Tax=Xanthobacter dioxanivorans TaxID=2528964 RepID=A0A974SI30_9HYPH|nr:ABC transporter ATP-binding protein [Xanthobacter dioxanivorans]QRG06941.1 ABC transporter ATP-binding protein [Xanthobacter dioxanivorans]